MRAAYILLIRRPTLRLSPSAEAGLSDDKKKSNDWEKVQIFRYLTYRGANWIVCLSRHGDELRMTLSTVGLRDWGCLDENIWIHVVSFDGRRLQSHNAFHTNGTAQSFTGT